MAPLPTLYTIGHSNHSEEALLALLQAHGVGRVVDVRSRPYSRFAHFGRERMQAWLQAAGIAYGWMGDSLGGRPADAALLGPDGRPDYAAMAQHPAFQRGLAELLALLHAPPPTAVLCSEGDPARCHREHLIAAALRPRGVTVRHILRSGAAEQLGLPV